MEIINVVEHFPINTFLKLRIAEHKMAIKKIKTWIKLLQGKAQGRTTLICCLCCIHKDYETLLVVAAL